MAALHVACLSAQQSALSPLLQRGAWLEAADCDDRTPLSHAAASRGGASLVRALLAAGAYPDAPDKRGLTPLAHAVANDEAESTEALLAAGASAGGKPGGASLLHLACALGRLEPARLLLSRGLVGADECGNEGRLTPAHAAAAGGWPKLLQLLLAAKAPANALSADGKTPLDLLDALPPDAQTDRAACEALLQKSGGKKAGELSASQRRAAAPPPAPTPDPPPAAQGALAAQRFAALSASAQREQLERWSSPGEGPLPASGAVPPNASATEPPLPPAAATALGDARRLLRSCELHEVILRLLEDDGWQRLMASPVVRSAVEAVQADPSAIKAWERVPACMEALAQLRRLQAFCKPRGLRTSLPTLLRSGDNTADGRRARMEAERGAAQAAMQAAREELMRVAEGRGGKEPAAAAVASDALDTLTADEAGRAEEALVRPQPSFGLLFLRKALQMCISFAVTLAIFRLMGIDLFEERRKSGHAQLDPMADDTFEL